MSHSPSQSTSTPLPSSSSTKVYPQFILLGDSITEGSSLIVEARLSQWYARRLDVINRGFGGYTAPMGYEVLQELFPITTDDNYNSPSQDGTTSMPRIQMMTVFFGANDACVAGYPQHVHLDTYISTLKSIVTYLILNQHNTNIILITPPPIDEWKLGGGDRTAVHTAKYARAALDLGQELKLPVLDLWTIFMRKAGWEEGSTGSLAGSREAPKNKVLGELLEDGLHFTQKGYDLMFDELVLVIQQHLPDQVPEKLPMIFPDWKDKLGVVR